MRVLIIGLDGFTWKTLDYMRKHVRMENLEKLMGQSAWGRLESTKPPSTVPAWISFATGVNPGKHGVFTFVQPASSLGTLPVVSSRNIRTHTFWELLRKRGMRSVLINLPCATPALTDDVTLGSFISEKKDRIHPKELGVLDEISDYRLTVESDFNWGPKKYLDEYSEVVESRFKAAKRLFRGKWNLFFILFSVTDHLQHHFYNVIKDGTLGEYKDEIAAHYKRIDDILGWFMENKGDDTVLMLMSDHGFESYQYGFSINNFLRKHGFLKYKRGSLAPITETNKEMREKEKKKVKLDVKGIVKPLYRNNVTRKALVGAYRLVKKLVPIEKYIQLEKFENVVPDPVNSSALAPLGDSIFLNTKARYKDGTLSDEEAEKVKAEIIRLLREEKSPFTGKSPFVSIQDAREVYHGPHCSGGPDILVNFSDHNPATGHFSDEPYIEQTINSHDPYGIFLVNGPGVKAGKMEDRDILDIAPTALHALGLPLPSYMDGKPLIDAFGPDSEIAKRGVQNEEMMPARGFGDRLKRFRPDSLKK